MLMAVSIIVFNSRSLILNFTANGEGIAYLYVRVLVVDGNGKAILITIIINVRRWKDR